MGRLQDKVAIVTGGNSGIGRAAALLFAREGASVAVAARREAEGRAVADRIVREGSKAIFVRTDVAVADDHRKLVDATVAAFGRLDLAFNNAGMAQSGTAIADLGEDEWNRVIAVNLTGVFLAMKHQIPAMLEAGGGAIVNTSSVGGLVANPGLSAYQASKHAVIGLTKVAALELAQRNIRVNAICPGGTRSEMFDQWTADPAVNAQVLAAHPIGRFSDPAEQAEAALFLLSDKASYVTGVALPVDGGMTVP
ncbi:SDR family NAD(P)-dependent oxidoreductase [Azospirillum picis]|uniref:NAD(P)-dependent dehydrogenase (Short-subunit alcohol dehydrogenase family) n=1 Tax=Azospirillum picis TaxID=488438 RepID=A0ABU0MQK3_9PROT|nr:SDR family oxidoreductase [Azospirillum picis]MBP2302100.1 NAD(P)-dependent dehydrogenase (short-subunit alcohol dehydrogenase family) [Azospirillum picis]MDQ0535609.1 NAD(P)-dependent dehydrogenase (short-subunit alcohol dehydrogenase family) [Azospirillum picis]